MVSLSQRCRQPEIMDQPDLDPRQHAAALRGLARLNFFGSAGVLWPALTALAQAGGGRPMRILDLATGGGDVPLRLWRRARKAGIKLQLEGCDISPFAVEQATAAATKTASDVHFFVHDAVRGGPIPGYDAVISSLFLHHLSEDDVCMFLRNMAACAPLLLINDLERGPLNYAAVFTASRLLTRSPVVHVDALRSVAAAFTLNEARRLAADAGLHGATVSRRWPCRFLLTWRRT
jgi:2-polyprenyl-3-methyl-5-hydroxy-6-metoxy-1,4-benzoquinol methylase